jgi:hypothetical protein
MMRREMAAIALCAAALVAGCGGDDDDQPTGQAATPTATGTPAGTATATPTPTEQAATGALAHETVKARGAKTTMIDLAIAKFEVRDKLATLTVSYTVHDPEAEPDAKFSLYELNDEQPLYVTLVDPVNLKRYNVVKDSSGQALQSGEVETKVPLDGSTTAQYTFAAPPADVTEIDVMVGDWPPFRDVPITR